MQPSGDASAEAALLQGVACGDATSVRALVAALDVAYGASGARLGEGIAASGCAGAASSPHLNTNPEGMAN